MFGVRKFGEKRGSRALATKLDEGWTKGRLHPRGRGLKRRCMKYCGNSPSLDFLLDLIERGGNGWLIGVNRVKGIADEKKIEGGWASMAAWKKE